MSDAAVTAIQKLRSKLINLGASNRLLNFKHPAGVSGSQSALRFVGKPLDEFFTRIRDNKRLGVEPVPAPSDHDLRQFYAETRDLPSLQGDDARNLKKPDAQLWARYLGWTVSHELPIGADGPDGDQHPGNGRVRTLLYPDDLDARLRRLRSNARLAIEESGSNMLFFAFGFLEWYDKGPQTDRQPYRAPLILVPAAIEPVKNARGVSSLTISSTGEDLQQNLSLKKKLAVDFGIDLPEFDPDQSPENYFDCVYQVVGRQDSWRIRRFVTLTLLTNLGKLLLYLDLDPDRWPEGGKPADHQIVRCLVGDGGRARSAAGPLSDEREIAKKIDLDLCLLDRADETQSRVLLKALDGANLVIQGPPGTGKSQTITNLIAAALHRGKTVLFVAEKLAALEVVKRRLREIGLGDFCLELHSHKTRKKAFFQDLAARLSKRSPGTPASLANALAALSARRAELDDYASVIRKRAGQTGYTTADLLFEAGRVRAEHPALAQTVDQNELSARVGALIDPLSINSFSAAATIQALRLAAQACRALAPFGGPLGCPWRGVQAQLLAVQPLLAQRCLTNWRDKAKMASEAIAALNAGTGFNLVSRPATLEELQRLADCPVDLAALLPLTVEVKTAWNELSREFDLRFSTGFRGLSQARRLLELMNSTKHDALSCAHEGLDAPNAVATLERLEQALQRRAHLVLDLQGRIANPEAGNVDAPTLRAAGNLLKQSALLTRLGREWRDARRLARSIQSSGISLRPKAQGEALLTLAERVLIDLDLENDPEIRAVCGVHFRRAKTDVAKLSRALQWRRTVSAEFGERGERGIRDMILRAHADDLIAIHDRIHRPVDDLMRHLSGVDTERYTDSETDAWVTIAESIASGTLADTLVSCEDPQSVACFMQRVRKAAEAGREWKEAEEHAITALAIDPVAWFGSAEEVTAEGTVERAHRALKVPNALSLWLTYVQARTVALKSNAGPLLEAIENGLIDPEEVEKVWRIAWLTEAAQRLYSTEPILLRFNGFQLDALRKDYAGLDSSVMELRRRAVSAQLMRRQPPAGVQSPNTKQLTQLALLNKCINLQHGHPAIRDVTTRAGEALQALKPCFMMGPLSVAQYLAPGALKFDLVIMDEASQIRPEEAIGAVARGDQLVIVGDDKQLPPTSFFTRLGAGVDDGDGLDGDGGFVGQNDGSVLALANSSFGGQDILRWHYRSRHPELIAFSNHQFYDNELVIFPAPQESDHELGLTRIFTDDGCAVNGVNDAEARRVAQAAVDHLSLRPSQSLMVVAMNIKQKECIESHIAKLQTDNERLGEILDDSEADARIEPFVVKNLENVQGDERDVVMISMTYGPAQPGGRVPQTFGPINQANGHRRLNVLFTRAKERTVVFTSMRSSDIQAGPGGSLGVQALRDFLWYAETKVLPSGASPTGKLPESPFEEAVARELERAGYKVEPQLGVGSYRIDIAVRNPDAPQQFLLGVECDGAMYHSTLSARDRDRLRQEVLENLGWEIERIWSVGWFRDPTSEMKRVLKRLDSLRQLPPVEQPAAPQNSEETRKLTKEGAIKSEVGYRPRKQIEGLPRDLKKALAAS